jgi:hypothetical protein
LPALNFKHSRSAGLGVENGYITTPDVQLEHRRFKGIWGGGTIMERVLCRHGRAVNYNNLQSLKCSPSTVQTFCRGASIERSTLSGKIVRFRRILLRAIQGFADITLSRAGFGT